MLKTNNMIYIKFLHFFILLGIFFLIFYSKIKASIILLHNLYSASEECNKY